MYRKSTDNCSASRYCYLLISILHMVDKNSEDCLSLPLHMKYYLLIPDETASPSSISKICNVWGDVKTYIYTDRTFYHTQ